MKTLIIHAAYGTTLAAAIGNAHVENKTIRFGSEYAIEEVQMKTGKIRAVLKGVSNA